MFKTITPLLICDNETRVALNSTNFPVAVDAYPRITDPDKTQWSNMGFADQARFGESSPVFVGAYDARVFCVQIRERVLPAKVIAGKLAEEIASVSKRQGFPCNRKQIAELKDGVVAGLLPEAFIKPVDIMCMIVGDYLLIGTGSASKVDEVVHLIRSVCHDAALRLASLPGARPVTLWMSNLLLGETTVSGVFNRGSSVTLKNDDAVVRFKAMDLSSEEIGQHVAAGMEPTELEVSHGDRCTFKMTDHMVIKSLALSDVLVDDAQLGADPGDSVAQFDSLVALMAGEIASLLNNLLAEMPLVAEADDATQDEEL